MNILVPKSGNLNISKNWKVFFISLKGSVQFLSEPAGSLIKGIEQILWGFFRWERAKGTLKHWKIIKYAKKFGKN